LENSKTYYGGTFLDEKDLAETRSNHKIELEYYTTKAYGEVNEESETYGVEIVKKEYEGTEVKIELNYHENICNNINKINEVIEILKRCKVTPMGLDDVIEEIYKRAITE